MTKTILGAKKSSVSATRTFNELTSCCGVSGADNERLTVGIVTLSAYIEDAKKNNISKALII